MNSHYNSNGFLNGHELLRELYKSLEAYSTKYLLTQKERRRVLIKVLPIYYRKIREDDDLPLESHLAYFDQVLDSLCLDISKINQMHSDNIVEIDNSILANPILEKKENVFLNAIKEPIMLEKITTFLVGYRIKHNLHQNDVHETLKKTVFNYFNLIQSDQDLEGSIQDFIKVLKKNLGELNQ